MGGCLLFSRISILVFSLAMAILLFEFVPRSALASEAKDLIEQGNNAYRSEDFSGALAAYEKALELGQDSSGLYYNIGNTAYRMGRSALALAAFRLAQDRAPRDPEILANISFIQATRDEIPAQSNTPLALFWSVVVQLSVNEYLYLSSAFLTMFFVAMGLRRVVSGGSVFSKRFILVAPWLFALLFFIVSAAGSWLHGETKVFARGVVVASKVPLRSEASEGSLVLGELPRTMEFRVLQRVPEGLQRRSVQSLLEAADPAAPPSEGWFRVHAQPGFAGWVKASDVLVY